MRAAAARDGFDLVPASAFRDFSTQLGIWNDKWTGRRPLVGRDGTLLEAAALTPPERVEAILLWSAVPGASRHHWGTDLDIYDRAAMPDGYRLKLTADEYAPAGPFGRLSAWLEARMADYGFYRPYRRDRGGVQPEPWHLSHYPVAREASRRFRLATLAETLSAASIEGRDALLEKLPSVYARYVRNVERAPRVRSLASAPERAQVAEHQ